MNSRFSVRQAVIADADVMGKVHTESWKTTYQGILTQHFLDRIDLQKRIVSAEARVQRSETDPFSSCFVLIEEGSQKLVGFSDHGPCREKNLDCDGEIYTIYLLKPYQGYGGGRLLFETTLSSAFQKGFTKILVSVFKQNRSSCQFYEKMGGKLIGYDHVDVDDQRHVTCSYIWKVSDSFNKGKY